MVLLHGYILEILNYYPGVCSGTSVEAVNNSIEDGEEGAISELVGCILDWWR